MTSDSDVKLLNYLSLCHKMDDKSLANITWELKRGYIIEGIRARDNNGNRLALFPTPKAFYIPWWRW